MTLFYGALGAGALMMVCLLWRKAARLAVLVLITLLYWLWESKAQGDIRPDLLVLYPALFLAYIFLLWQRWRWVAVLFAALLMAVNMVFFGMSYEWFKKYPG